MKATVKLIFLIGIFCCCENKSQKITRDLNVLILGNSITVHGPVPEQGWYGDWGMAASAQDKDFVHVLIGKLKEYRPKRTVNCNFQNIAYWESNFDYDFLTYSSMKALIESDFQPDLLIIRLGENSQPEYLKNNDYEKALIKLIDRFKTTSTRVLITGNFWPSPYKDSILKKIAQDRNYPFVPLDDLSLDLDNKAVKTFTGGVGEHPSDLGMYSIAERIFDKIEEEKLVE